MKGSDFITSKKMALLAGMAALAGGILLTRTDKKAAESVVFNARGFPKKLRIEFNENLTPAGLSHIFYPQKGYYFAYNPHFGYEEEVMYRSQNTYRYSSGFTIFNERFEDSDILFTRQSYEGEIRDGFRQWYGHFGNLGLKMDLIDAVEWLPELLHSEIKLRMADKTVKTDIISKDKWDGLWISEIGRGNDDRREAYWGLYTNGDYDSQMQDEPTIYGEMAGFFAEVRDLTFTKINELSEQEEYDAQIKMFNDEIDLTGTWPKLLVRWDSINNPFGGTPFEDIEGYALSKDMIKIQVEWWLLKQNYLYYIFYEENITPLLNAGWNSDKGVLIQNNRSAWDAYRDSEDVPNSHKRLVTVMNETQIAHRFYSKNLIVKNILKKRPMFIKAINEDAKKVEQMATHAGDVASLEAAEELRENLATTPPFKNLNNYYAISSNHTDISHYAEPFINEIIDLYNLGEKHLTEAEKNSIKPKIQECFEDIKITNLEIQVALNIKAIADLKGSVVKRNDALAKLWTV